MINNTDPLDSNAIALAKTLFTRSPKLEANQSISHIYQHWVASAYQLGNNDGGCAGSYNYLIDLRTDQDKWQLLIPTDPRQNAVTVGEGAPYAAHTWERNSHALGIAVACMGGAGVGEHNFGAFPVQKHEIEALCACVAALAWLYRVPLDVTRNMTHAEAAILDGYFVTDRPADGITRWDLARLAASPEPLTKQEAVQTGNLLRSRQEQYYYAIRPGNGQQKGRS